MEDKGKHDHGGSLNNSENPISESPIDRPPTGGELTSNPSAEGHGESTVSFNQSEIFRAIQVVERDSLAIAESFVSLFDSLRLALSEVTGSSVDHMQCFCDATGRLQESGRDPCEVGLSEISLLEATTKGNRYINSCLRLNEEMKSINGLASQLKVLRRNVDSLDSAVNKLLHSP
ncbi:uncharacterized protein LOC129311191 isoform X5 [Prosopis cineraria]|uniref:uncharacterized protein LOC129311191 isoform X5 n=1 Tax=Prosopis cineraria TaxID=364024 RepID=UPI0024101286|nr:uncharacterized protein LOC129311191 isoform X5 [Prosopis cineraria]